METDPYLIFKDYLEGELNYEQARGALLAAGFPLDEVATCMLFITDAHQKKSKLVEIVSRVLLEVCSTH